MIRYSNVPILAIALLPFALILITFGIYVLSTEKKNGIWLRLALMVNSSLVLILGVIGCGGAKSEVPDEEEFVMCYMMPASDITEIPQTFDESADWQSLESSLISLEYYISTESDDTAAVESLIETARTSIINLRDNNLINEDDEQLLRAYVGSRDFYYHTSVCGIKCYDVKVLPEGKPQIREDIVDAMDQLRFIYASGDIETKAYDTALANLEEQLKLYTGKKDNAVLRQLLLDLTDGMSGEHY